MLSKGHLDKAAQLEQIFFGVVDSMISRNFQVWFILENQFTVELLNNLCLLVSQKGT